MNVPATQLLDIAEFTRRLVFNALIGSGVIEAIEKHLDELPVAKGK